MTTTQAPHGTVCPYCSRPAQRVTGAALYPHRANEVALARKMFFACVPCGAWVGVHDRTGEPLGSLANKELREARRRGHAAFDPLWKEPRPVFANRGLAYEWLANIAGVDREHAHFAQLRDITVIDRVVIEARDIHKRHRRAQATAKAKATRAERSKLEQRQEADLADAARRLARALRDPL